MLNRMRKDERGITALETAIILIAFVVVAAVFAFTVLSTGTFLTERSKEAAYSGLQEVRGSMELKGSLVLDSSGTAQLVTFNLATVAGGSSTDLSKLRITFRTSSSDTLLSYQGATATGTSGASQWAAIDGSNATPTAKKILASGELAKIIIQPPSALTNNQTFAVEVKPETGGVMLIERTTPAQLDTVTDLH